MANDDEAQVGLERAVVLLIEDTVEIEPLGKGAHDRLGQFAEQRRTRQNTLASEGSTTPWSAMGNVGIRPTAIGSSWSN